MELPLRRQKNSLQNRLQRPCCSGSYAHDESKQMKAWLALEVQFVCSILVDVKNLGPTTALLRTY